METVRIPVNDQVIDRRLTAYTKPGFVLVAPPAPLPLQELPDPLFSVLRQPSRWMAAPLYLMDAERCHPVYLLYPFNPASPFRFGLRGDAFRAQPDPSAWVEQKLLDTLKSAVSRLRAAGYSCNAAWAVNSHGLRSTLRREGVEPRVVPHDPAVAASTADRLRRMAHVLGVPTTATGWAIRPGVGNALQAQARPGEITWIR